MPTTDKHVIVVTIRDAAKLTNEARQRAADWLKQQAERLVAQGETYEETYRGRY